jgi:hypothetical protein
MLNIVKNIARHTLSDEIKALDDEIKVLKREARVRSRRLFEACRAQDDLLLEVKDLTLQMEAVEEESRWMDDIYRQEYDIVLAERDGLIWETQHQLRLQYRRLVVRCQPAASKHGASAEQMAASIAQKEGWWTEGLEKVKV